MMHDEIAGHQIDAESAGQSVRNQTDRTPPAGSAAVRPLSRKVISTCVSDGRRTRAEIVTVQPGGRLAISSLSMSSKSRRAGLVRVEFRQGLRRFTTTANCRAASSVCSFSARRHEVGQAHPVVEIDEVFRQPEFASRVLMRAILN